MRPVLSVDLAHSDYGANGLCLLDGDAGSRTARFLPIELSGRPDAEALSIWLDTLATDHGSRLLLLDGPQGWKCSDPLDGCSQDEGRHSRLCERQANCPGKTGYPGQVKPRTYTAFMSFSIEVYQHLTDRGWSIYSGERLDLERRCVVETFPLAAWRTLRLPYLRAKSKATAVDLKNRLDDLLRLFPGLLVEGTPSHDQLQALVAGIAGVQLTEHGTEGVVMYGRSPHRVDGSWREGFILCPGRPGFVAAGEGLNRPEGMDPAVAATAPAPQRRSGWPRGRA